MTKNGKITTARLNELLQYDCATGVFTWRVSRRGHVRAGDVAGSVKRWPDGLYRRVIKLDGKNYYAAHLAWFLEHGRWPRPEIDHIDNDTLNDRIENLREATRGQNARNRGMSSNNQIGYKGVYVRYGRYRAQIGVDDKKIYLGAFDSPEAAHAAYCEASKKYHGEFGKAGS